MRNAGCHPVGVKGLDIDREPRALPWAVEYDPLGVADGDTEGTFSQWIAGRRALPPDRRRKERPCGASAPGYRAERGGETNHPMEGIPRALFRP